LKVSERTYRLVYDVAQEPSAGLILNSGLSQALQETMKAGAEETRASGSAAGLAGSRRQPLARLPDSTGGRKPSHPRSRVRGPYPLECCCHLARTKQGKDNDRENKNPQYDVRDYVCFARHVHSPPWPVSLNAIEPMVSWFAFLPDAGDLLAVRRLLLSIATVREEVEASYRMGG
jgi:hypothetical protein